LDRPRVGPYRVREKLAEGAVAATFRGEHEKLGRPALLKALKGTLAPGSPLGAALEREAKILGKLSHPSIVSLFECEVGTTSAYLALEDVRGPRLRAVLERAGKLDPAVATAIALGLASGLGHAHARSVVHGDVRPEGIVIAKEGRAVLVDFGAATDLGVPASPAPFDGSERLSGPEYAAPEQIVGEPPSPRSDVFSLGIVLYEMLSGARPWDEGAVGAKEVARRVRSEDVPPLQSRGVVAPRSLDRILARCLGKRPEERYEDGEALAVALSEALDEMTAVSSAALITRALAAAKLGEEISEEKARRKPRPKPAPMPLLPLAQRLAFLSFLIIATAALVEGLLREDDVPSEANGAAESGEKGFLRVLARPWAEVLVDGKYVDVTPIGRPIPVLAGRHYVTFKHPNAPDEKREIRVGAGQTVLLDVTMRIDRPTVDAGVDASVDASP